MSSIHKEESFINLTHSDFTAMQNAATVTCVSIEAIFLSSLYLLLRAYNYQDKVLVAFNLPIVISNNSDGSTNKDKLRIVLLEQEILNELSVIDFVCSINLNLLNMHMNISVSGREIISNDSDESSNMIPLVFFSLSQYDISALKELEHFDFGLYLKYEDKVANAEMVYSLDKFNTDIITSYRSTYRLILEQLTAILLKNDFKQKLDSIYYVSKNAYKKIIIDYNSSKEEMASDKLLHQLFEEQSAKTPNRVALIHKGIKLTYRDLNQRANQLAHYLLDTYSAKIGKMVILCLDRSENIVVAILSVLKVGAAYVPVDPSYPDKRIEYIIQDTCSKVILTDEVYFERLSILMGKLDEVNKLGVSPNIELNYSASSVKVAVIAIDNVNVQHELAEKIRTNPSVTVDKLTLAYVIYTSGTTGAPKGVMQKHANVVKLFANTSKLYQFTADDIWLLFHSYTFDFAVWEMWGALLYGGRLVVPTISQVKDSNELFNLSKREGITILNQTPQAFYQFIDVAIKPEYMAESLGLKYIILGGDKLDTAKLRPWFKNFGYENPQLINMYGITETTIHVTYLRLFPAYSKSSFIGRAIPGQKLYVLDNKLRPLPVWAIGELYVGGQYLALGYLNNPQLTKERFIINPFQTQEEKLVNKNDQIYKTGDLVRILPDGNFEYLGRNDFQVKIRGYRVELGEIEACLNSHPQIKQSVVKVFDRSENSALVEDGNYLVAYYVSDTKIDSGELLNFLNKQLPQYMLPVFLVHLNKFPLTVNGKVDRQCLLKPEFSISNIYLLPRNQIESKLRTIFAMVLHLPVTVIGVMDSFFHLGGDSILVIKLVSCINSIFGYNLKVVDIFVNDTIEKLSHLIAEYKGSFQLISNLKPRLDKLNLFMIHPSQAGSEVYIPLAEKFSRVFSCYGVDNYNLQHIKKVDNLMELSKMYLSAIDTIRSNTDQGDQPYFLFGWSSGGQIALEIASILETRCCQEVYIILLDTVLIDDVLKRYWVYTDKEMQKTYDQLILSGYSNDYVTNVVNNLECENKLTYQEISGTLSFTNVFLFKAVKYADSSVIYSKEINEHIASLKFNNVDKVVINLENLQVMVVEDMNHNNIKEHIDLICLISCLWIMQF